MAKFAGVSQGTVYTWETGNSCYRSMGISKKRAWELVHKIGPVDPFVAKELAVSLGCLLPEGPKPGMCSGLIGKSWPRRLCSKRATVTVGGCGFCKQHSPSKAEMEKMIGNSQASMFGQKIKSVMEAHPGLAPHRDIDVPLGPFQDLADSLEDALGVPGLMFVVDASFNHGVVSVVALLQYRKVWDLVFRCSSNTALMSQDSHVHKPFEVVIDSFMIGCSDKPGPLNRSFRVECDDATGVADHLMQYIDDARFGAEMHTLRKIVLAVVRK